MRRSIRGESAWGGELKTSGSTLRKGAGPCRTVTPRSISEWLNLAPDVMRARACLEAEKAGGQIDKPADKLVA